jgi:hypothetical protein
VTAIEQGDLWPEEDVVWSGFPTAKPMMWWGARTGFASGIGLWGALVIYVDVLSDTLLEIGVGLLSFGMVGAIVGAIAARVLLQRTAYAVTNRRILFLIGRSHYTVARWFGLQGLEGVRVVERSDGSGDIVFTRSKAEIEKFWRTAGEGGTSDRFADFIRKRLGVSRAGSDVDAFLGIPDVQHVRKTIDRVLTFPRPPAS